MNPQSATWPQAATANAIDTHTNEDGRVTFDELFMAEYPRAVAIANRVLADPDEAEEVAQEIFVSFHRGHAPDAPYAGPWLHAAATHAALNRLRSNRRRTRREEAVAVRENEGEEDPAELVVASAQREEIRLAMSRLPARMSAVLALRYSGLSYAEVAAALGVGIGSVGTLLKRAESRLRLEVEK